MIIFDFQYLLYFFKMKTLKYILFLLLIGIIGTAIYIAVQPNEFEVTRTRTIEAPAAVVYDNVIDFKNWEAWSSWAEADPDMAITLPEQTKGVNGSYSWEDKDGVGTMEITDATPYVSIQQRMQFAEFPPSDVSWNFNPNEDGSTDVKWTISGKNLPFVFKMFSVLMGGMEKQIGPHYERSLEKLDSIVVNSMKAYIINIDGITEYGGGFYMYKTTSATGTNISQIMGEQYGEIMGYMASHSIKQTGMPFTIYHNMDIAENGIIMSQAIPVQNKVTVTGDSNVLCGYIPKTRVLKTTLNGNYTNLPKAWEAAMKHLEIKNIEQSDILPFEIYQTDPGEVPNPANWITEIYIPIKE